MYSFSRHFCLSLSTLMSESCLSVCLFVSHSRSFCLPAYTPSDQEGYGRKHDNFILTSHTQGWIKTQLPVNHPLCVSVESGCQGSRGPAPAPDVALRRPIMDKQVVHTQTDLGGTNRVCLICVSLLPHLYYLCCFLSTACLCSLLRVNRWTYKPIYVQQLLVNTTSTFTPSTAISLLTLIPPLYCL